MSSNERLCECAEDDRESVESKRAEGVCDGRQGRVARGDMHISGETGTTGFAANSYADAIAKAACSLERTNDVSEIIKGAMRWKRYVHEVWVRGGQGGGRWEVWDVAPYVAMKEAIGWWIVQKEYKEHKEARVQ